MAEKGLPVAKVQTYAEAAQDPHVLERDMLQDVKQEDGTTLPITGPAAKFSRTPTKVRRPAPELGSHSREVLGELGYDEGAINALVEAGIAIG